MKSISNRIPVHLSVAALVCAALAAGSALAFSHESAKDSPSEHPAVNIPLDEGSVPRDTLPRGSFAPIVKRVSPGVVKIETTSTIKNASMQGWPGGPDDPFFQQFFGNRFGRMH